MAKKFVKKQKFINILNYKQKPEAVLFKSMSDIELLFGSTMTFFAGVYLLGRMFKNFDMTEIEKRLTTVALIRMN